MPRFNLSPALQKGLLALGLPLAVFVFARFLLPLVLPTVLGLLLSRPLFRLTDRLSRRLPRSVAAGLALGGTLLLAGGVLGLLAWQLSREAGLMLQELPELLAQLPDALQQIGDRFRQWAGALPGQLRRYLMSAAEELLSRGVHIPARLYGFLSSFLSETMLRLPAAAIFLTVLLLSAFFFCRDHKTLGRALRSHLPRRWLASLDWLKARCEDTFLRWLKVQGALGLVTFFLLLAGFLLMRLPTAFFSALLIALLDMLPIIGAGTALLPWAGVCALTGRWQTAVGLLLLWGLCWLCRTLLEPRFLAARLGLHPVWTLLTVYLGFSLSGVWGMLFYPLFAILLKQVWLWGLPEHTADP